MAGRKVRPSACAGDRRGRTCPALMGSSLDRRTEHNAGIGKRGASLSGGRRAVVARALVTNSTEFRNSNMRSIARGVHLRLDERHQVVRRRRGRETAFVGDLGNRRGDVRRDFPIAATSTNCCNNYGPYQFPEKVIPLFATRALAGVSLPLYAST